MLLHVIVFSVLIATSLAQPEGRIVNGTDAKEGEFPSIVSIQTNVAGVRKHHCGGTILDATHILTAAHCVYGVDYTYFSVQYGIVNIFNSEENIIQVIDTSSHDQYVPSEGYVNDVAIVVLESPIPFSEDVQPTVLPEPNSETPAGNPAVVAGWGHQMSGGSNQANLQKAALKIYSDEDCETAYGNVTNRKYHICSGIPEGGRGQCQADSGGPLYSNGVQLGVVSWSRRPCASPGFPGVFVKVANYVDWIRAKTK